ncbi:MAG: preprotein translocase subunit SecE [Gaiellaceae bacterium]
MARQTRNERRARRAQGQPALAGGPPAGPPATRRTAAGGEEPARRPARSDEQRGGSGFGPFRFVQESLAELRKVEWPDQKAVVSGTAVVLIACVIVGTYLWLNDEVWKYVVQHVLLR